MENKEVKGTGTEIVKKEMSELAKKFNFATALFKSGMFPNANSEYGVLAIIEYGNELGLPPVTSLQHIANIQGKLCLSAQMLLGLAVRNGVKFKVIKNTDAECRILFIKGEVEYESTFTIEEAKKAFLVKSGGSWEKYPKDMLWARSVARGVRKVDPLSLTAYTVEEMEDVEKPVITPTKTKQNWEMFWHIVKTKLQLTEDQAHELAGIPSFSEAVNTGTYTLKDILDIIKSKVATMKEAEEVSQNKETATQGLEEKQKKEETAVLSEEANND